MDTLDIRTIIPLLKQLGIDPSRLSCDKLEHVMNITKNVRSPDQITPELTTALLDVLGIGTKKPQKPVVRKRLKIGRNELCICESGKKYKKCCGCN